MYRSSLKRALVVGMSGVIAFAAVAMAADLVTDASLSADSALPTEVSIGDNSFQILLWATGSLPNNRTGEAKVVTKYFMSTAGVITPSASAADVSTVNFTDNYNYSQCATQVPANVQGCASNKFSFAATLVVAAGTPNGTTGTLVVSHTGSQSLTADSTPDEGFVRVVVAAPTNRPPVLTSPGNQTVAEGSTLAFNLSATDPDGDALTFSMTGHRNVSGADDNMSLTGAAFSWTPGDNYADYTVTFTATDPHGLSDSKTVTISSTNVNPTASANASPFSTALVAGGMSLTATFDYSDVGWHDTHTNSFFTWTINGGGPIVAAATISGEDDTADTPPREAGTASNTRLLGPGCYDVTVTGTAKDDDNGQSSALAIATNQQVDVPTVEFLAPIKDNERNIAKYGNVVPVKVRLTSSCTGASLTDTTLYISWAFGNGGEIIEGSETIATSVANSDTGNQMRVVDGFHLYNFSTRDFPTANQDYRVLIRYGASTGPIILTAVFQPKK